MSKETGGPAFPADPHAVAGMTLRDYFAAKVIQAIVSHDPTFSQKYVELAAKDAYAYADAMLSARSTEKAREQT